MPVVKALIGGLVGGCIGAYAASLFGPVRGAMGPWLILLAGIGAGLGVRLLCGTSRSFVTGIAAAITAIGGVTLFTYVSAAVALSTSDQMEAPLEVAKEVVEELEATVTGAEPKPDGESESDGEPADENPPTDEPPTDEPAAESDADAELPMEPERPVEARNDAPDPALVQKMSESNNVPQKKSNTMDLIANAVSALLAFVMGAGSAVPATKEPEDSQPNSSETA